MKKVSVIVNSLNSANYMRECMESIIGQTLEELEIICIDAGSEDGTQDIIKEYQAKDPRIKLLISDIRSSGIQRNMGIEAAEGEYIGFVETDDFINPDMFETLYNTGKETDADIVKSNYCAFAFDGADRIYIPHKIGRSSIYNKIINPAENREVFNAETFVWTGIYRRSFLNRHKIRFNTTLGASYQDNGFYFRTFTYAERIYFLDKAFYNYRLDNPNSSSNSKKKIYCICDEYENIQQHLSRDADKYKELIPILVKRKFLIYLWNQRRVPDEYKKEFAKKYHDEFCMHLEKNEIDLALYNKDETKKLLWLIYDEEKFADMINKEADQKWKNVDHLLKLIKNYEKIIVFGAGYLGTRFQHMLKMVDYGRNISCFCDNDTSKWNTYFNGVDIISPREAAEKNKDGFFIIANANNYEEMKRQLINYGIDEERIFIFLGYNFPRINNA